MRYDKICDSKITNVIQLNRLLNIYTILKEHQKVWTR